MDFGVKISKNKSGFGISILDIPCAPILGKTDNFEFLGPNLPKNGFWSRNFKDLSLDLESTPPLYYVCQLNRLHKLLRCFRCYPCVNNCWLVRTYHSVLLTYVMPLVSFYTPWKYQKISDIIMGFFMMIFRKQCSLTKNGFSGEHIKLFEPAFK